MSLSENNASDVASTSANAKLDDLDFLNFPDEIDWSSTLILRCDPEGAPYRLIDVTNGLHVVVRRNDVHNLGPTALNYVFTISFKSERATENFVRFLKDRRNKPLTVKDRPCMVSRIPSNCVNLCVRWIPIDVDTAHIVEVLKEYGKIVKTDLVQNDRQGWFHVYTGERKFRILLHDRVDVNALPYSIDVKGLYGAVFVSERNPKCLDCYHTGHKSENCKYKGFVFSQKIVPPPASLPNKCILNPQYSFAVNRCERSGLTRKSRPDYTTIQERWLPSTTVHSLVGYIDQ